MRGRWSSVSFLLVGLGLAAVLLLPAADNEVLVAQGVARLLAEDASRATEPDLSEGASIFRALESRARTRFSLAMLRHPGLERVELHTGFRRAFDSALNVYNAGRVERRLLPLAVAGRVDPGTLELEISILERDGRISLEALVRESGRQPLRVRPRGHWGVPLRASLLPPLVAILIALAFRRTVLALLAGVWVGAVWLRLESGTGWVGALLAGSGDVPAVYLYNELIDSFRIEIIGFVFTLVAMVGVMSRSGGIQGLADAVLRFARSARSTLAVSFGLGLSIFFDDYSNCLIVGNVMRPLTDRMRISREKLAYIVDSTAAPVAGLSLLSTWVAFEVSTFSAQLPGVGIFENPYVVFLQTIPYRFYCLFALAFVLLNIITGRDFGPMRRAERRASQTGEVVRADGSPMISDALTRIEMSPGMRPRARDALIPIATVVFVTIEEIFRFGGGYGLLAGDPSALLGLEGLTELLRKGGGTGPLFVGAAVGWWVASFLGGSNPTRCVLTIGAVLAASLRLWLAPWISPYVGEDLAGYAAVGLIFAASVLVTAPLLLGIGIRTARPSLTGVEICSASASSGRALSTAVAILFGAWMIGSVCQDVRTADYLVALTSGVITPELLPIILFGAACVVSFATGTSWGTMSILLPNVVALAAAVGEEHMVGSSGMVLICIGAVLEGSIFGDHCSPISDTTVLSSVATASDHLDHVQTQAPYALSVAVIAVLAGYLPTLLLPFWSLPMALSAGIGAMLLLLFGLGRRPAPPTAGDAAGEMRSGPA